MYLNLIQLENYRNYRKTKIGFDQSTNLIIGENGQGKTNLLEAIYFLSTGSSHRNSSQNELINRESEYFLLRSEFTGTHSGLTKIEIQIRKEGTSKIKVDGVLEKNKSSFTSIIPSVIFTPDDLRIIKAGPSNRRDFLDLVAEKTVKGFKSLKNSYNKTLNQRNSLLKTINDKVDYSSNSTLGIWEERLSEYGSKIIKARLEIFDSTRDIFKKSMAKFFSEPDIEIDYILSWNRKKNQAQVDNRDELDDLEELFLEKIRSRRKDDIRFKTTSIGPHRDDFNITLDGMDLRSFGSQGQQRVAAISLKLSEFEYLKKRLKKTPILLLDDVLSELDTNKQKILLDVLSKKIQTFITTTDDIKLKELKSCKRYEIKDGSVKKII